MEKNAFVELFGSDLELLSKSGTVKASSLTQKAGVLIYFSAHWCPPCRGFTPKLAEVYNKCHADKNFEILFVSSDKDQAAFDEYYGEMPWLAVPFAERDLKEKLSRKYKVSGIPTLVVLDPQANLITDKGRAKVTEDSDCQHFPWIPKKFPEIFAGDLIDGTGATVSTDTLKEKTAIGLYFSAHWCPPCRGFTPKLVQTYNKLKQEGKSFEIVFCSSDRDKEAFDEYFAEMPWLSLPFGDSRKSELSDLFDVEGIPTFVVINPSSGEIISANGRGAVDADPEGKDFPWYPKPLSSVDMAGDDLNEKACFCYLNDSISEEEKASLSKLASGYWDQWKAEGKSSDDYPLCFFYGPATSGLGDRIRSFANITANPVSVILNIPDRNKFIAENEDNATFISNFLAGKATPLPLK